jgi:multidrug efflux system membrane fusion protein
VSPGATLFTIDPRQYQAALRQADAQLVKDQALLRKAESDVQRYGQLVKQDFVTKQDYDQAVATAEALRATVASDQATIDNARLQVAYCTITSPLEGRTGNLNVKVGNLIKADDTPLVIINQIRPIFATVAVPAQYLPAVLKKNANPIRVSARASGSSAPPAEGTLTFVDNAVDTATSTVLIKATFANQDESLWPGQFVDVTVILGEEPNRTVVPSPAVQTGQQGQYVYVVKSDDTVELRPVKVDRLDETDAVIAQGLSGGETVVTDGQLRLIPGAKIVAKEGGTPGAGKP